MNREQSSLPDAVTDVPAAAVHAHRPVEPAALRPLDDPDRAEVDEPKSAVFFQKNVAGVQVGVEDAVDEDLLDHGGHQHLGQPVALCGVEGGEGIGLGRVMARADAEESRTVLSRSSDPLLVPARL